MMITDLAVIPDLDALDPDDQRPCLWTDVDMLPAAEDEHGVTAAKEVCGPCPVRDACEAAARSIPGLLGVWGGTTEGDRDVIDIDVPDPSEHPEPCGDCGERMAKKGTGSKPGGLRFHFGKGLCSTCYMRARRRAQRQAENDR